MTESTIQIDVHNVQRLIWLLDGCCLILMAVAAAKDGDDSSKSSAVEDRNNWQQGMPRYCDSVTRMTRRYVHDITPWSRLFIVRTTTFVALRRVLIADLVSSTHSRRVYYLP